MSSDDQLSILFLSSWFPTEDQPTLGNFVKRHAQSVAQYAKVTVLHHAEANEERIETHSDGNYREVIYYHRKRFPAYLHHNGYYEKVLAELERTVDFKPDIIHLNVIYPAGRIALKWAKQWNIPFIVSEHWTGYHNDTHSGIKSWQRKVMKEVGNKAAFLCPVTMDLARSMQNQGIQGKYEPVPNVVDTELFHMQVAEQHKSFRFLHVSSLFDQHKNVSGLLNAFSEVTKLHPEAHLTVLGDGDPLPHQRSAEKLGIPQEAISFAAEQTLESIAQLMRESDCFVLFSRYENLPCVIGEAWASGVPVISTDVGGIREHLDAAKGHLIASEDESALKDAMIDCLTGKTSYSKEALRSYASEHFSYEAVGAKFMELYRIAINNHPK